MPSAIETSHLRKDFGDKTAVDDLSLAVERGEVFGFLGPNGAGKTTSVKMLLGLVHPTSGEGQVLGRSLGHPATRAKVGFLPEHFRFHSWLTGQEFLKLHSELYGMSATDARQRLPELLELVGLSPHAGKRLGGYSKGMLQRIGLAQALLNRPELVFLDEPTSGLDPFGRRLVRDIIRDQRKQGTTIFLNSHLLSEIEVTCDRVAFIKQGQVVRTASLKELADGELSVEVRAHNLTPDIIAGLGQWCRFINTESEFLSLTLSDESLIPEINRYLVGQGVDVFALRPQRLSLEDLFVRIIEKDEGY
ncbi:MAG TPA: ABC transporter ATP-binding protein [Anaerolineales bacterium]|nr:ABC transporter ATP-binding protein [Anaerolineales bacterium]